jgi:hypothetical protein
MQLGTTRRARRMGRQASNRAYITGMEGRLKAQGRQRERAFRAEPWCKQDLFLWRTRFGAGLRSAKLRASYLDLRARSGRKRSSLEFMQPRSRGRHGQNGHLLVARQFAPATLAVRPRSGADRTAEKGDACDSVERASENWCEHRPKINGAVWGSIWLLEGCHSDQHTWRAGHMVKSANSPNSTLISRSNGAGLRDH